MVLQADKPKAAINATITVSILITTPFVVKKESSFVAFEF
jgi:hypothetical protein